MTDDRPPPLDNELTDEFVLRANGDMGRGDIALLLLDAGARMDIFAAAMLGESEIVIAMLTARPELATARGPHGIPLVAHAEAGGDEAREVFELPQHAPTGV
jgi:hypothetical protein